MIELYKNIKKLRKEHGWSQDELAQRMGYKDRSSIAKIETGAVDIPRSKILEFAKVFNIAPGDLMGWDNEVPEYDPGMLTLMETYSALDDEMKQRLISYATFLRIDSSHHPTDNK
jgi:transcriptional regulator with XRE-family HTH domain